jgi:ubiquitin thioesterase protein OTUB1
MFQISESIALVGEKEPLMSLEQEYAKDDVYLSKAKALAQKYSYIRRTRPDGNCFFRAFSYAYLEKLIGNKEEYDKFRDLALKSKDSLVALGFPQFTVEDFHDTVIFYVFHKYLNLSYIYQSIFLIFKLWKSMAIIMMSN